uniref:Pkinase-domain-containing protein n=1 Tax=Tetraselmis sp. GSL018 TaxID=582737 RepID=A0A061SC97_9CHLO|eukprot:CAMPEP_0177594548 /NCGR_PEP_ID=MMETSP0419_2-20121207/9842_1 /TAXON_ID=582737 /ORGANISM="Tetraselmis sp., Strain GSL018" /LENGTH=359 /DNA_ID=CAMNT_0019085869 /DNA_START=84 /DNA_END=1163 /DNA_ORIENTATION=-
MNTLPRLSNLIRKLQLKEGRITDNITEPVQGNKTSRAKTLGGERRELTSATPEEKFWAKYEVIPDLTLGNGASSTVIGLTPANVTDQSASRRRLACKIVKFVSEVSDSQAGQTTRYHMERELQVLKSVRHPNLLNLEDYFLGDTKCCLVTEMLEGGDLQQALEFRGSFPEEDAQSIMFGLLSGVAHLHQHGIAHRDIKLENILLVNEYDLTMVKVVDLGMAKPLGNASLNSICGTPLFMAPEVLRPSEKEHGCYRARYGLEADNWSCGVVLYMLLSGKPPFESNGLYGLFKDIQQGAFSLRDPAWDLVSSSAKELVVSLLNVDPNKRSTATEALNHPWMNTAAYYAHGKTSQKGHSTSL